MEISIMNKSEYINGNTRIGFCSISELGYCKKCEKIFKYYYNLYSGLRKGEGNCPICGSGDIYGDVIRSRNLDMLIQMSHSLSYSNLLTDIQKSKITDETNELSRIKKLFSEYEERNHEL